VGGPAIHVTSLTSRLPVPRFESRLFAGDVAEGEAEMTEVLEREGVTAIRVPGLGRAIKGRQDALALWRLIRELRRFRPHIVHTHTAKGGTLGRLAARLCGVPIVVHTFHGHVFDGYFHPLVARGFVAIERGLGRITDAIVTLSPRQRADITERYRIVPRYRTYVVPLGFDLARFVEAARLRGELRRELGIGDAPLVTIVGRLTAIKDHALLFAAMARVEGAHLCVVGGGEQERELREQASGLGLSGRAHFLGFRADLDRILADTDVVALTSKNEGTPVALIEALAAGCSVAAAAVGGVPDVLEEGRWGELASERTPEAVADAVHRALVAHRARPMRAVEAARTYVLDKYGIDRLVTDHVCLYEELLDRTRVE
jgi:glycosyltransferase involved in cell wall biosynthesis